MGKSNTKKVTPWIFSIIILIILAGRFYYIFFYTPKNSLELYQAMSFADDFEEAQQLMLEGYEERLEKGDFEFINRLETTATRISQFTLFEYEDKTFVLMTTPGTTKLQVLAVEELPTEIRNYFIHLGE